MRPVWGLGSMSMDKRDAANIFALRILPSTWIKSIATYCTSCVTYSHGCSLTAVSVHQPTYSPTASHILSSSVPPLIRDPHSCLPLKL